MIEEKQKARELVTKFGKEIADKVCDTIIGEVQSFETNQHFKGVLTDYYLDVKNIIKKIS